MAFQTFGRKQRLAMMWWKLPGTREFDAIICDGSVRSGKTVAMTLGFFLWSMASFNHQTFALCGRTVGALRRNIVHHLSGWLGGLFSVTERYAQNKLTLRCGDRENTYYLFGGENEGSYKTIQGITLAGALLDEVALMPRSFVEQTVARCSVPGSRLWFNCNPEGPEHWFYREWILEQKEKNALRLHFTMDDNPGLDPAIRQRYGRLYRGVFYDRYILGLWRIAEGLVYAFDRRRHTTEELPQEGAFYISVDYGTMNPFSAGLWCVSGGRAVRIDEYYHDGRATGEQKTDEEYYEALEALAGDRQILRIVIDPSAASLIALIRRRGRFTVRKARNGVLPGIRLVASLLEEGVISIGSNCKNAIREFGLYRWEEDGARDRPRKEHDHAMDDIRYFCATVLGRNWERSG